MGELNYYPPPGYVDPEHEKLKREICEAKRNHFLFLCLEDQYFTFAPQGWEEFYNVFSLHNVFCRIDFIISPEEAKDFDSWQRRGFDELFSFMREEISENLSKRLVAALPTFPEFFRTTAVNNPELIIAWRQSQGLHHSAYISPDLLFGCLLNWSTHPYSLYDRYFSVRVGLASEHNRNFVIRQAINIAEETFDNFNPDALLNQQSDKNDWSKAFPKRPRYEEDRPSRVLYSKWLELTGNTGASVAMWDCLVLAHIIKLEYQAKNGKSFLE